MVEKLIYDSEHPAKKIEKLKNLIFPPKNEDQAFVLFIKGRKLSSSLQNTGLADSK